MVSVKETTFFIFDFDSTITSVEALDVLADYKGASLGESERNTLKESIVKLTTEAMNGQLSFREALQKRLDLLQLLPDDITWLIPQLKEKISSSFLQNKSFFSTYSNQIFVISGGFEEYIIPVVEELGIKPEHVFANRFLVSSTGYLQADQEAALSRDQGKVIALETLPIRGELIVIGDGYTDYEMKAKGKANTFVLYAEHCNRNDSIPEYDQIIFSLDELLNSLHG